MIAPYIFFRVVVGNWSATVPKIGDVICGIAAFGSLPFFAAICSAIDTLCLEGLQVTKM